MNCDVHRLLEDWLKVTAVMGYVGTIPSSPETLDLFANARSENPFKGLFHAHYGRDAVALPKHSPNIAAAMKGHIFVLVGPSGAGKTTLANALTCEGLGHRIITWTTRPPRPGEVPGRDYVFVTPSQFDVAFRQGDLVEREYLYGTWYGTPVTSLQDTLHQNQIVVISMGLEGARTIKQRWSSQSTIVAVLPPNPATLHQRLAQRGTSEHDFAVRWPTMQQEVEEARQLADYLIINDDLSQAIDDLKKIVSARTLSSF